MKKLTEEVKSNIDHGIPIHETMMNYPKVFDTLTTSLIKV
jgi:type II secretory pathway component PulF